jgi:hypothetical protein
MKGCVQMNGPQVSSNSVIDLAKACERKLPEFQKEYDSYLRMAKRTGVWPYKTNRILFIERILAWGKLIQELAAQGNREGQAA